MEIRIKDTIMLLHGGGLSWWNYREEAEMIQEVIILLFQYRWTFR